MPGNYDSLEDSRSERETWGRRGRPDARAGTRGTRRARIRTIGRRGQLVAVAVNLVLLGAAVYGVTELRADHSGGESADPNDAGPSAAGSAPAPPAGSGAAVGFPRWDYAPGRCYSWPRGSASPLVYDVPCEGVHHFEAVGSTNIREDYPAGAAYPTPPRWETVANRYCIPVIEQYLGHRLDPNGRFRPGLMRPLENAWKTNQRAISCGISAGTTSDPPEFIPFEGGAFGADQSFVYPTGTCLRRESDGLFVDVPCGTPHHAESIGPVTSPETGDGAPPSEAWQNERLGAQCMSSAARYLEVGHFGDALVNAQWGLLRPESWRTGTRRTTCFIGFTDDAGSPVPVTGSITAPVI